jgi:cyclophilin family peptidyl-prolyl cis-trans isomerase/HEAT repeat protein
MIKLGLLLSGLATLVVTFSLPASGATPPPYQVILTLESKRSLGNGALAAFLRSPDERIATRAALAVGRTKRAAGEPLLAAHLNDARDPVRAMSVYAIGLLATGGHARAIVTALDDRSGAVRVAALDAIARYEAGRRFRTSAEAAAQAAVGRTLVHDGEPIVRARAATTLVEFRHATRVPDAASALVAAFGKDADPSVRWHVMWTIYRGFALKVPRSFVQAALQDRDELVRIEAVRAMSRYHDRALVTVVRPLLDDPSWRVQEQAAETLRVLQGKPLSDRWVAIPPFVHVPQRQPDALAAVPAVGSHVAGKPSPPLPAQAIFKPLLDPSTASQMTSPAPGPHPRVRIVTTKGNVYVVLYPEWAPLTVANFLNLAARGYYDRNRWFRIVPDFVVQTGDPNDNGNGDAGYTVGAEENPIEQRSFVISMGMNYDNKTQTPIRDSAGTQYYVTLSPQLHLDRDFTVFGAVTGGFDVLARLVESDRVVRIERLADASI